MDQLGYTFDEALARVPIGRTRLSEAIRSGALPAHKYGRRVVILHDDIVNFLKALPALKTSKQERIGPAS